MIRAGLLVALITLLLPAPAVHAGDEDVRLAVPYRSQRDGTAYAGANCGPASVGMALAAFDVVRPTHDLRLLANKLQGTHGYDDGIAVEYLAEIVERHGLRVFDFYRGAEIRRWTLDQARAHLRSGHPVIPQLWFRALPGRWDSRYQFDHYLVLVGTAGEDFLYNDPLDDDGPGAARRMSAEQLTKAWRSSDEPWAALAVGPVGESPLLPRRPVAEHSPGSQVAGSAEPLALWPVESRFEGPLVAARATEPAPSAGPVTPVLSSRSGQRSAYDLEVLAPSVPGGPVATLVMAVHHLVTSAGAPPYEIGAAQGTGFDSRGGERAAPAAASGREITAARPLATLAVALHQLVAPLLPLRG